MHKFLYHSRMIENERSNSFHEQMHKVGNILHSVVKLFGMVIVVTLLNLLLHNITRFTNVIGINTLRAIEDGVCLIINGSTMSVITYLYEHLWGSMLAIVCIAVSFALCVYLGFDNVLCLVNTRRRIQSCNAQNGTSRSVAVSYRHKVCFLS